MKIKTKFGMANMTEKGYYIIVSRKEGNFGKLLHRLVFEDFYKIKLPSDIVIHHDDRDKTNNEIWNLIPMSKKEHDDFHRKYGEDNPNYGKPLPKETRQKISNANKGQKRSLEHKQNMSKSRNDSGYFRVCKRKRKDTTQGFLWCYDYLKDNKRKTITSVNLNQLEQKVKAKGLDWIVFDDEKAQEVD